MGMALSLLALVVSMFLIILIRLGKAGAFFRWIVYTLGVGILGVGVRTFLFPEKPGPLDDCSAYIKAQLLYQRTDWDRDGVLEFAANVRDLRDKKPGDGQVGLIDPEFAQADARATLPQPKNGYLFKVLRGAQSGREAVSYLQGANMVKGFALLAYPADYAEGARNSYVTDRTGTVYMKDLGGSTATIAKAMESYSISGWERVK